MRATSETDAPSPPEDESTWGPPVAFHFAYCTEAIMNAKPMDTAAFLLEVKRRAGTAKLPKDPLASARELLGKIEPTAEGQALRRVLEAVANKKGTFRESDVYLFSADTLAIVTALVDARIEGRYRDDEWQAALGG